MNKTGQTVSHVPEQIVPQIPEQVRLNAKDYLTGLQENPCIRSSAGHLPPLLLAACL